MTIEEIEQSLRVSAADHTFVHTRFGIDFVDVSPQFLLEVLAQIKKTVVLLQSGLVDAKDHRAEAFALMLLDGAYHFGYTPGSKALNP